MTKFKQYDTMVLDKEREFKMIKTRTDLKNTKEVLRMAMDNELEAWQIEGVLNDEWLIEDYDHTISINGRRSDYIILTYEFLNSWGNTLYVIQTNDRKVYNEYMERYEEYWESLEEDF